MSNPGGFRIQINTETYCGISDPRNSDMLKMFDLIDIGACVGSRNSNIFRVWRQQKWMTPRIEKSIDSERTVLTVSLQNAASSNKDAAVDPIDFYL